MTYLQNIQSNQAAYRAALAKRAARAIINHSMMSYFFLDLSVDHRNAAMERYHETYATLTANGWRFNSFGERIA